MQPAWTLPPALLTDLRDNARAAAPAIADTLARTVMAQLPDAMFAQLAASLTREVQNRLVGHLYSAAYREVGGAGAAPPAFNEPVVTLWASEVAAYLDRDTYHSRLQMLGRVWRRVNEACAEEVRKQWLARGRRPRGVVEAPLPITPQQDPFPDVQTAADAQAFCAHSSAGQRAKLYMAKGVLLEEDTSGLLARHLAQPVVLRNSSSVWAAATGTVRSVAARTIRGPGPVNDPGAYVIHGEVDGWLLEPPYANVIVEYKLRIRGAKEAVPERDILQIQTYLAMHGVDKALHVQRTFGTAELKLTTITRDPVLWDTVIRPGLDAFVCDVRRLLRGALEDEPLRHTVLLATERLPAISAAAVAQPPANLQRVEPTVTLAAPADIAEPIAPVCVPATPVMPTPTPTPRKVAKRKRPVAMAAVPVAAPPRETRTAALRAIAKMSAVIAEGHLAPRSHGRAQRRV